jgi:hypothetical protein
MKKCKICKHYSPEHYLQGEKVDLCKNPENKQITIWAEGDEFPYKQDMQVSDNFACNRFEPITNKTPKHYNFKIQPIDVIDDWGLDFYRGNAVKYIARAGRKGSAVEDINKAIHYLELYKERILDGNK